MALANLMGPMILMGTAEWSRRAWVLLISHALLCTGLLGCADGGSSPDNEADLAADTDAGTGDGDRPTDAGASADSTDSAARLPSVGDARDAATPEAGGEEPRLPDAADTDPGRDASPSEAVMTDPAPSDTTEIDASAPNVTPNDDAGSQQPEPASAPSIEYFIASEYQLPPSGGTVNLSWSTDGAETLSIEPGPGNVTGERISIEVLETTSFTLMAQNEHGSSKASLTVTVNAPPVIPERNKLYLHDVTPGPDGSVYVVGSVAAGTTERAEQEAFVAQVSGQGAVLWSKVFGSGQFDSARAVAVDADGDVVVVGATEGAFGLPEPGASSDLYASNVFIVKLSEGEQVWARALDSGQSEEPADVAIDTDGNLIVVGGTTGPMDTEQPGVVDGYYVPGVFVPGYGDYFVAKYSPDGEVVWVRQSNAPNSEGANAVAIDGSGNAHVVGWTNSVLGMDYGGTDAFWAKYDPAGALVQITEFGASYIDNATAVVVSEDQIVIGGFTTGALEVPFGGEDAFLRGQAIDTEQPSFTRQLGTSTSDRVVDLLVDTEGAIYVVGDTEGQLGDGKLPDDVGADPFVGALTSTGTFTWLTQVPGAQDDTVTGGAITSDGAIIIVGYADGGADDDVMLGRLARLTKDGQLEWSRTLDVAWLMQTP